MTWTPKGAPSRSQGDFNLDLSIVVAASFDGGAFLTGDFGDRDVDGETLKHAAIGLNVHMESHP